jgi:hypothetical protein
MSIVRVGIAMIVVMGVALAGPKPKTKAATSAAPSGWDGSYGPPSGLQEASGMSCPGDQNNERASYTISHGRLVFDVKWTDRTEGDDKTNNGPRKFHVDVPLKDVDRATQKRDAPSATAWARVDASISIDPFDVPVMDYRTGSYTTKKFDKAHVTASWLNFPAGSAYGSGREGDVLFQIGTGDDHVGCGASKLTGRDFKTPNVKCVPNGRVCYGDRTLCCGHCSTDGASDVKGVCQ